MQPKFNNWQRWLDWGIIIKNNMIKMERNAPDSNANSRENTQRRDDSKDNSKTQKVKEETSKQLKENLDRKS